MGRRRADGALAAIQPDSTRLASIAPSPSGCNRLRIVARAKIHSRRIHSRHPTF